MLMEISEKNNITFVMVTHDPELAKKAKRVVTLVDGKIIHDTKQESEGNIDEQKQ